MSASGLPITQLGLTVKSHVSAAEKYVGKTEERYKAAIHLKEGMDRLKAAARNKAHPDYIEGGFSVWCIQHCRIGDSRAFELMAIANGTTTADRVREGGATRAREFRQRQATSKPTWTTSPLRNGPPAVSATQAAEDALFRERLALLDSFKTVGEAMSIEQLRAALLILKTL